MPTPKPIMIQPFGGLSDSVYAGTPDSLDECVGWDIHTKPGVLGVRQALAKVSGVTVDEFVKTAAPCTDGYTYYGSSESGKIYRRASDGTWSLAYTVAPDQDAAAILGLIEFHDYLYIATQSRLHRIPVAGTSDWATNIVLNWAELNLDQDQIGGTGNTYTLTTSVNEGATHQQTFQPIRTPQQAIAVNIVAKGTGDWTLVVHDASNTLIASKTITNANLSSGWNAFVFASVYTPNVLDTYHIHIYSSVADGTVQSAIASDLTGGNIKIYTTSDDEFHPMIEQNQTLFIGDRSAVHQVFENVFTNRVLDINNPLRIKCFGIIDTDILVGTYVADNVNKTSVFRWNTFSTLVTSSDPIEEVGINAFLPGDNFVIVNAGQSGNLYTYNGAKLDQFKTIAGDYSPTKSGQIHPNAVANLKGHILFGFSNISGNPTEQGVYCLSRHNRNYPLVLDLSFPISERSGDAFVLTDIEIGVVVVEGSDVFVSWKHNTAVGIDQLDYTTKLDGAFFTTRSMTTTRTQEDTYGPINLAHEPLATGCHVAIATARNQSPSFVTQTIVQDDDRNISYVEDKLNATRLQVRVTAETSGNNAPAVELLEVWPNG